MKDKADFGMIGLAVMGENLALNLESKGYTVAVYNRTVPKVEEGVVEAFMLGRGQHKKFIGSTDLNSFVQSLAKPRKIMMMIKAGKPVDEMIDQLIPLLEEGDIIIDGGNSHFPDTNRRTVAVEQHGLRYIGSGISGGEQGALTGPSIMPGGSLSAWPFVKPILQNIAAKVDGESCCDWIGENGAGHFVKMVHNGIEYGDMQLICEAYQIMKELLQMTPDEMHEVFDHWNRGELASYLIEISSEILRFKENGEPLIDKILDTAGQKGTGKWTGITALDLGVPLTLIGEAVFARCLSAQKEERVRASAALTGPSVTFTGDRQDFIEDLRQALFASKIISYAQGYVLMREAAKTYGWDLNYAGIAKVWKGGCIIRSAFLSEIQKAFIAEPDLSNLLLNDFFKNKVSTAQVAWRKVVATAITQGISIPAMAAALTYFDGYRTARLPANLLQAQRDYFGAHTYERIDRPRGQFFHTNWTGEGGQTASTTYNV